MIFHCVEFGELSGKFKKLLGRDFLPIREHVLSGGGCAIKGANLEAVYEIVNGDFILTATMGENVCGYLEWIYFMCQNAGINRIYIYTKRGRALARHYRNYGFICTGKVSDGYNEYYIPVLYSHKRKNLKSLLLPVGFKVSVLGG